MAKDFDIFNPAVSQIAHGLEGKTIMLYGTNNVGKTNQAVRAKKPLILACENGLNGVSGVKYIPIKSWARFKKTVKDLTDEKKLEKAKEFYQTIIIDEVYASSMYCQDFICSTYGNGAIDLGDDTGNSKMNLYKLYEKEYWRVINSLVNAGYTVIFIGHQAADTKTGYISPKGDKRCLNPIIDNCDIVAYIQPNGVDEDGNEIKSSAYFVQTNEFFGRSRYPYMEKMLQEFTIEGLERVIEEGIQRQAEAEGLVTVSYEEQKEAAEEVVKTFEELKVVLDAYGNALYESGHIEELVGVVEENLGAGKKAGDLKKGQEQVMEIIIDELADLCEELGINVTVE